MSLGFVASFSKLPRTACERVLQIHGEKAHTL